MIKNLSNLHNEVQMNGYLKIVDFISATDAENLETKTLKAFRKASNNFFHTQTDFVKVISITQKDSKKIKIKWPNDLLFNKLKFCGILQEVIKFNNFDYLIVGIGLNTNTVPQNKSFKSTCLKNILNKKIDNQQILKKIVIAYEKFLGEKNKLSFSDLKMKYK